MNRTQNESNSRILIVDDQEIGRITLESLLLNQGYALQFAQNGPEALELARIHNPDLILLDVMMPGMDGFEVCRRLRSDPVLREVPIILLTALDDRDAVLEGIEAGADDYIVKPYDRTELRTRIRAILRLNRYRTLHAQRSRFEWVIENSRSAYIMLNADGQVGYMNSQAHTLLDRIPAGDGNGQERPGPLALDRQTGDESADFVDILSAAGYVMQPERYWAEWLNESEERWGSFHLVRGEGRDHPARWLQAELKRMSQDEVWARLDDVSGEMLNKQVMWSFQSQVAHKLRTPLTLLLGNLTLLEDILSEDPLGGEIVEPILNAANRLDREVGQIFQLVDSWGPDRTSLPRFRGTDLCPLLDACKADFPNLTLVTELQGTDSLPPDGPVWAISAQALEQILLELFENSVKFHPTHAPTIHLRMNVEADQVVLELTDDGVHLPAEQLQRIWDPYFQAERFFTGQIPGMGLGLTIVASLLLEVGGQYSANNREDAPGIKWVLQIPLMR